MHNAACHRTRLAANNVVSIDRCSCSTIHLNVGALSLRFTGEAFERLASAVCEALGRAAALRRAAEIGAEAPLGASPRGEA
jgi:hypothetical protein